MTATAPIENKSDLERMARRFVLDIRQELREDKLVWPSIPSVMQRIRKVMKDPEASVDDIAKAVSADPALATRVLRFANSAIYGSARTCQELREAIVRLGNDALEHTVMLFVVGQVFSVGKRRQIQPHLVNLWRHSTLVASLCERLSHQHRSLKPEVATLAGLIHDIGALPVLVRAERVPELLARTNIINPLVRAVHTEVGRGMLDAWEVPAALVLAVSKHEHTARDESPTPDYADLVIAANVLSRLDTKHPHGAIDVNTIPAFTKLGVSSDDVATLLEEAKATEKQLWQ